MNGGLHYYRVPMPADAQGVRFHLDPGAFNGGDAMYLRFSATPGEVAAFLAKLHATTDGESAEAVWNEDPEDQDASFIPWNFDGPDDFAVYGYTVHGSADTPGGLVTVDRSSPDPVVYVFAMGGS